MIKVVDGWNQETMSAQLGKVLSESLVNFAAHSGFALFGADFSKLFRVQDLLQIVLVDGPEFV